jgi:histidinol phosphatase-like PHP family hydrolase
MTEWLLTDLHIHTTFSDGTIPIEEVVKIYGEARFDAIAITDHLFDTQSPRSLELYDEGKSIKDLKGYFYRIEEVSRWAQETYDLLVIPGLEICNLVEDYHILGIDLKEAINPSQNAEGVIQEIHHQGGLAIASHPHLKLSYFIEDDKVSIRNHPTGIGILEDETDRIFEAFYRGRNHSAQAGVGLGLSFAKQAVEFHGGKILVQSEPQKGSIFSILLPVKSRIKLSKAADN